MTLWRALGALLAARAASFYASDVTELLQSHKVTAHEAIDASQGALRELAEMLSKAKKECRIKQSKFCLPLLQDLRKRLWPYVLGELAETNARLDLSPNKIREEHMPKTDIFRAVLKPNLCGGAARPIYFVDLTESVSNQGILEDLNGVSRERLTLQAKESKVTNCKSLVNKGERKKFDTAFVMVRDPLERFISGYASIEKSLKQAPVEEYQFLDMVPRANLTERVTLFLHRFFKDGANYSSHVSSMSEYMGSMFNTCPELPKKYFAKVENAEKKWTKFLLQRGCKKVLKRFSAFGTNTTGGKFAVAMDALVTNKEPPAPPSDEKIWGKGPQKKEPSRKDSKKPNSQRSMLQMTAATEAYALAMTNVLGLTNYVYLRAFCWFSLPDYVIFEYELPTACHREDLDVILKLTRQRNSEDPVINPGLKNNSTQKSDGDNVIIQEENEEQRVEVEKTPKGKANQKV